MKKKGKISMKKIKEVFRLHYRQKLSNRGIAKACNISPTTVSDYLKRASEGNICFDDIESLDEESIVALLYPDEKKDPEKEKLDFNYIHEQLKKKGVTRQLLWEEYKKDNPSGYKRSQFFQLYKDWARSLSPVMRMTHKAGEKMFVDFSGDKPYYIDPLTGEMVYVELFIAVLGASSYTFATAVRSQNLEEWIRAHIETFEYFGGCPEIIVPDNLKSGVKRACYYDPDLNPTYAEMIEYYTIAAIPTRPYKPKDKAKVENGVLNAQRRILATLRHITFFNLPDLNKGIREALEDLNHRQMQVIKKSRYELFIEIDKPALIPLPPQRFTLCTWKKAKVNIDYHIEIENSYYSVPYKFLHKQVEAKYNNLVVQIYYKGKRIASHPRSDEKGKFITDEAHRPPSHAGYLEWTPERIKRWGKSIGEHTESMMEKIMKSRRHVEQGYRTCLGILRLSKRYSPQRLENACKRALLIGGISYRSVRSILETNLDSVRDVEQESEGSGIIHENIRGRGYYKEKGNV
jgi:transposase